MKTILLAPTAEEATAFRFNAGLSPRECVFVTSGATLLGAKFAEEDLILEWPRFRELHPKADEIVKALKVAIARGGNAGPEWVSNPIVTITP